MKNVEDDFGNSNCEEINGPAACHNLFEVFDNPV